MTSFIEDHIGSLTAVVVMKDLASEPKLVGVSYTTEDVNGNIIRTGALKTKIVLNPVQQQKLDNFFATLIPIAEGELGLAPGSGGGGTTTGQNSINVRGVTISVGSKISINGTVFTVTAIVGTRLTCKTAKGRIEFHNALTINFHIVS